MRNHVNRHTKAGDPLVCTIEGCSSNISHEWANGSLLLRHYYDCHTITPTDASQPEKAKKAVGRAVLDMLMAKEVERPSSKKMAKKARRKYGIATGNGDYRRLSVPAAQALGVAPPLPAAPSGSLLSRARLPGQDLTTGSAADEHGADEELPSWAMEPQRGNEGASSAVAWTASEEPAAMLPPRTRMLHRPRLRLGVGTIEAQCSDKPNPAAGVQLHYTLHSTAIQFDQVEHFSVPPRGSTNGETAASATGLQFLRHIPRRRPQRRGTSVGVVSGGSLMITRHQMAPGPRGKIAGPWVKHSHQRGGIREPPPQYYQTQTQTHGWAAGDPQWQHTPQAGVGYGADRGMATAPPLGDGWARGNGLPRTTAVEESSRARSESWQGQWAAPHSSHDGASFEHSAGAGDLWPRVSFGPGGPLPSRAPPAGPPGPTHSQAEEYSSSGMPMATDLPVGMPARGPVSHDTNAAWWGPPLDCDITDDV
jgi:hypothetical protein